MQVQNIIRASADVLTITHLTVGNVYKRVDTNYNGDASIKFGVVQSVMNNGTDAAITALEYEADYNGARATIRVITAAKDVAIFPATPEEVIVHLAELEERALDARDRATQELAKREAEVQAVVRLRANVGALTEPETAELPA